MLSDIDFTFCISVTVFILFRPACLSSILSFLIHTVSPSHLHSPSPSTTPLNHRHTQEPGYWTSVNIPISPSPQLHGKSTITIHDSIEAWRKTFANLNTNETLTQRILVRQSCHEPHCQQQVCPETFNTSIDKSVQWVFEAQIAVVVCVLAILMGSMAMWLCLKLHYCCLHHRQRNYLDNHALYRNLSNATEAGPYSVSHMILVT